MLHVDSSGEAIWNRTIKGCKYMVGILSDIGKVRKTNQDCVGYFEDEFKRMYVIADGMGGHNGGETASKVAVETTINMIRNAFEIKNLENALSEAVKCANAEIYKLAQTDVKLNGMGTTITACLVQGNEMVVAHVGDSSCFVLNDKELLKVTKDHSLVQQLIDTGTITELEAKTHPNKNIITRALGTNMFVQVDAYHVDLKDISKVLLCTDGLTNAVSFDETCHIARSNDNNTACEMLVRLANENGGKDNISVILFEGGCKK